LNEDQKIQLGVNTCKYAALEQDKEGSRTVSKGRRINAQPVSVKAAEKQQNRAGQGHPDSLRTNEMQQVNSQFYYLLPAFANRQNLARK
jgi:hypothetical protein